MLDNILLLLAAFVTGLFGVLFIAMNTSNNVGPYFMAGLFITFSVLSTYVAVKYWKEF